MNRWAKLTALNRPYWTLHDFSETFKLLPPSARVFASRKVKSGELIRARRDLYLLPSAFEQFTERELFRLSNLLQTPSYISFATALSYHGLTTQVLPATIEAANPVRARTFRVQSVTFRYYYVKPDYYFGYHREDRVFIAEPEKALLDGLYLNALGRYTMDLSALDLKDLQWLRLENWLKKYPQRLRTYYKKWRKKYEDLAAS